jgi:hypothetical protein
VTGDFTSPPLRDGDTWTGARLQQGRVLLDGDWNLNIDAAARVQRHLALGAIGPAGVLQGSTAFEISFNSDGTLQIGAGSIWVGGMYAVNLAPLDYSDQEAIAALPGSGQALVYLDAFMQEVQAAEDPGEMLDLALDGVDTTTRTRVAWRVRAVPVTAANCTDAAGALPADLVSSGLLDIAPTTPTTAADPCAPPDDPRAKLPDGLLRVEVLDSGTETTARFAWSYENGSAAVAATVAGTTVTLAPSPSVTFFQNDLVEVSTLQRRADRMPHGPLFTVASVTPGAAGNTVTLSAPSAVTGAPSGLCLRRWDGQVIGAATSVAATLAGADVGVTFTAQPGNYLAGDWWVTQVRGSSADAIQQLTAALPDGTPHLAAPLALVDLTARAVLSDCRPQFQSLTAIKSGTCTVDVGPMDVDGGASLQALLGNYANRGPVTVRLSPGTYTLPAPLVLGPELSGITLQSCREGVVLQAVSGAEPNFTLGLIAIQGAGSVTIRGLELSLPLAMFSPSSNSFSGLPAPNRALLTSFSTGLQVAIGVSATDCAGLTIEDCTFDLPAPSQANLFGAGIYATGRMQDVEVSKCTFQCANPPQTVPFYALAAGSQVQPTTPYHLTFGYLQVPIPTTSIGTTGTVSTLNTVQLLHDSAIEQCVFLGMTVPALVMTRLGAVHIGQNTVRNCYGGFWLVSINLAQVDPLFNQIAVGNPTQYLIAAQQGRAPMLDRVFVMASAIGQSLPVPPPAATTGGGLVPQIDFQDCQVDAVIANSYSGVGLLITDLAQNAGSAVIHGNRIRNRFLAGDTALADSLATASITGNIMANEVEPPPQPSFSRANSFSMVLRPTPTPLAVAAVAVTGNVFIDAVILPARPKTAAALPDWTTLNTVTPYAIPLSVTGISPSSGPIAGGTPVTITGTGFVWVNSVQFGSAPADAFTIASDTQIAATSPPGAGTVGVTVTTAGMSAAASFTYTGSPPAVTQISPNSGSPAGGNNVIITGSGFTSAEGVQFGSAGAHFTVASDTQISATSPPGSGTVDVTVTNPAGVSAISPADQFTYVPPIGTTTGGGTVSSGGTRTGGAGGTAGGAGGAGGGTARALVAGGAAVGGGQPLVRTPLARQGAMPPQARGNGVLAGKVTDPGGAPLSGLRVYLTYSNGFEHETGTTNTGQYLFTNLGHGHYTLVTGDRRRNVTIGPDCSAIRPERADVAAVRLSPGLRLQHARESAQAPVPPTGVQADPSTIHGITKVPADQPAAAGSSLSDSPFRTPIQIQANGWASNCEQLSRAVTREGSPATRIVAKTRDSQISGRIRGEQQTTNMRRVLKVISQHADESDWLLTEDFIKDLNRIVLSGIPQESDGAGEYRSAGNFVVDGFQSVVFIPPRPDECPPLVADLVQQANKWVEERRGGSPGALHPVCIAAATCSRLIAIHPFANGNGRTARAAATMVLTTFGYRPLPPGRNHGGRAPARTLEWYFDRHLSDYYAGLHTAYCGNWPIWIEIFAEAVQATMSCPDVTTVPGGVLPGPTNIHAVAGDGIMINAHNVAGRPRP